MNRLSAIRPCLKYSQTADNAGGEGIKALWLRKGAPRAAADDMRNARACQPHARQRIKIGPIFSGRGGARMKGGGSCAIFVRLRRGHECIVYIIADFKCARLDGGAEEGGQRTVCAGGNCDFSGRALKHASRYAPPSRVRCANSAACTVADQYGGAISASDYACHMWLSGHTGICIRRAILIQRSLCADDLDMMDLFQPCGTRASESGQARAVLGHALRIIAGVKSEI